MLKHLCIILLFTSNVFWAQIKIVSWNLENLGKSKTNQDIEFMANTLKDFDVVAVQEVVAGYGGVQAVARLADELNRKGTKWDYVISNPTTGSAYKTERYAFLWKTARLQLIGKPWLEAKYKLEIDREPFYATFKTTTKEFTLVNFHAITKRQQPETEIKYFKFLPAQYPNLNLIFLGDFNCPESHTVFYPLKKMGYNSIFHNQKTTLKKECMDENCLASAYDNIWFNTSKTKISKAKAIHFYKAFESLALALQISDHIPISVEIN